ncbi:MAG: XRE family transcriptional regulator [Nitrospirae bacterium]|nr:MAG: XRE family transcriptional regulator [Nitrospirota bacterium]
MDLFEYVAKRLRELRASYGEAPGISQEVLAKEIKVTPNTISRWETGTYRPSLEDLNQLARFFGVSILEFFPPEQAVPDEGIAALLRTAKQLKPEDLDELRRYAEFRRARSLYPSGSRPQAGRKRTEVK